MPVPPSPADGYISSDQVPNGVDWGDGLDGRPGTPTPNGAELIVQAQGFDTQPLEEFPDSPDIERAEQGTIKHNFKIDYDNGLVYLAGLGRGTFMVDSAENITKILSSRLVRGRGNISTLSVTAESISFDTPPDEFRLSIIELNPALEKHPRYGFLPANIRQMVNQAVSAAMIKSANEATQLIAGISLYAGRPPIGTWTQVQAAANELLLKRRLGEDTFYLPGFEIVWSQYFYLPPSLNPGGYIEDPIDGGGLPYYFWSTDQTPFGDSIFDAMADINPQFYSAGISWLRQADYYEYVRTWFKITHTWHGAPFAQWDSQLYNQEPSPYPAPPPFPVSS